MGTGSARGPAASSEWARALRRVLPYALSISAWAWTTGCGYSGGKLLYMLGIGRESNVKAEFRLTSGPILILVDDVDERVDWPVAKYYIADELAQQLLRHKAAKRIVPHRTLQQLRQSDTDFQGRGCREVGELAGAQQVLWLQVQEFLAQEDISDASNAAYLAVVVKVINVLERDNRTRVRLWPGSSDGRLVAVQLAGDEVVRLGGVDAIARELARRIASTVGRLFYDYRADDFGTAS